MGKASGQRGKIKKTAGSGRNFGERGRSGFLSERSFGEGKKTKFGLGP